jgi:hypothetical protein
MLTVMVAAVVGTVQGDTIEGLAAKLYKEEKRDMPFLHWNFDQHYLYSQIEKFKKVQS